MEKWKNTLCVADETGAWGLDAHTRPMQVYVVQGNREREIEKEGKLALQESSKVLKDRQSGKEKETENKYNRPETTREKKETRASCTRTNTRTF